MNLLRIVTLGVIGLSFILPSGALPEMGSATPIIIDLAKGTVAGIPLRGSVEKLANTIGRGRIKETAVTVEGDTLEAYEISFGAHTVTKVGDDVFVVDEIFRTHEGLGVGSRAKDFEKTYGKGERLNAEWQWDLGIMHHSREKGYKFLLGIAFPKSEDVREVFRRFYAGEDLGDLKVGEIRMDSDP